MKTEEDFIKELESVCENRDNESAHVFADVILIEALRSLGYNKLAAKYEHYQNELPFWYA